MLVLFTILFLLVYVVSFWLTREGLRRDMYIWEEEPKLGYVLLTVVPILNTITACVHSLDYFEPKISKFCNWFFGTKNKNK